MEFPHPRTGTRFDSPVPPGSGWPGDPATAGTSVARDAGQVAAMAAAIADPNAPTSRMPSPRACPRLVQWREDVAVAKRKAFAEQPYWGRPAPGWGAVQPRILVLGLAPAAHGANRTGRVFTGDRSGDQLFAALHRTGLVNSPVSVDAADGLQANGIRVAAAVRCAPPGNAPTPGERSTCAPWLDAEWRLISPHVRVVVALGGFAWQAGLGLIGEKLTSKPKFGHGVSAEYPSGLVLLGCYHPSQQNMFTGRLTPAMLDTVFAQAAQLAGFRASAG